MLKDGHTRFKAVLTSVFTVIQALMTSDITFGQLLVPGINPFWEVGVYPLVFYDRIPFFEQRFDV